MGTAPSDPAVVSTSKALRTKFFLRGRGCEEPVSTPLFILLVYFVRRICFVIRPISMMYYPTLMGSK